MPSPHRARVLIADDARVMRMLVRTWLERLGYHVTEAASGTEVLAALATPQLTFDAVVCDIHMPGLTGLQVLETIRKDARWQPMPVILVTTLGHAADIERGLRLGATAYLTKPLGFSDLVRAMAHAVPHAPPQLQAGQG